MKKIISILLSMVDEAGLDCFMKEAMEKEIKKVDFYLLNKLGVGPLTKNKKGMGFITASPRDIFVEPEKCQKIEGYVAFKAIQGERGPIATSISKITEEEIATKIWEILLPEAEKEATKKRKIEVIKTSGDIKKFIKGVIPFINKFTIEEEEEYDGWSLRLQYEPVKGTCLYINLEKIEGDSFDFTVDIGTEDGVFSANREELSPEKKELYYAVVEETKKRKKEAEEKGEEIPNWGRSYSPEEEIKEEEIQKIFSNSIGC